MCIVYSPANSTRLPPTPNHLSSHKEIHTTVPRARSPLAIYLAQEHTTILTLPVLLPFLFLLFILLLLFFIRILDQPPVAAQSV